MPRARGTPRQPKQSRRGFSLPRVPLPRQIGGQHEDKTRRPFRKQKHRKTGDEE
ncbi:MAG TPA: hypothetical protein VL484_01925 [Vicinamibacterales bacterium]|nr:hypothetical protein [Vicinamibacterales bacterium]